MKNYTLLEALKEIAFLFPFQPFGKIADIHSIGYHSNAYTFIVTMYDDDKYFIDLDSQTFTKEN